MTDEIIDMRGSQTYTVREAAAQLGISHELLYRLIREDQCPVRFLRLGTSVRIPKVALHEYLEAGSD